MPFTYPARSIKYVIASSSTTATPWSWSYQSTGTDSVTSSTLGNVFLDDALTTTTGNWGTDCQSPWLIRKPIYVMGNGTDYTGTDTVDDLATELWQNLYQGTQAWAYANTPRVAPWGRPHIWAPLKKNPDREKACARAEELLVAHLTPHQRREYEEHGCFHVVTRKKHRYLIKKGRISNVIRLNKRGKPTRAFCLHPKMFVPDGDTMLTQKLMLETDEDEFLRIANHRKVHTRAQLIPWNPEAAVA